MTKLEIITLNKPGIADFAKERNLLLKKSNAEWVFFVDSDERVTPDLLKEVQHTLDKGRTLADGFCIKRKIFFLGKYIGTDKVLRLAKRNSGKWVRAVHEVWKVQSHTRGVMKNYLIHNTATDLHSYIAKMNSYSDMHAKENLKEGKRATLSKIIFYPIFKFVQNVVVGRGFVFSMLQSFHSFLAWSKEWLFQNA